MEVVVVIMVPVVFVAVFWTLGSVFFRSRKPLPEEAGLTPVHSETMGGRIGRLKFTAPFVRFALYDDFLVISSKERFSLRFSDIDSVEYTNDGKSGTLFKCVRIAHHSPDRPKHVFLYSVDGEKLARKINETLRA